MARGENEAFSRILIDKALEFSGWNILDPHQVRFELNTATGRTRLDALFQSKLRRVFNSEFITLAKHKYDTCNFNHYIIRDRFDR